MPIPDYPAISLERRGFNNTDAREMPTPDLPMSPPVSRGFLPMDIRKTSAQNRPTSFSQRGRFHDPDAGVKSSPGRREDMTSLSVDSSVGRTTTQDRPTSSPKREELDDADARKTPSLPTSPPVGEGFLHMDIRKTPTQNRTSSSQRRECNDANTRGTPAPGLLMSSAEGGEFFKVSDGKTTVQARPTSSPECEGFVPADFGSTSSQGRMLDANNRFAPEPQEEVAVTGRISGGPKKTNNIQ